MPTVKIIGMSGTDAAGKDTVGEVIAEQYGWQLVSVTDLLRDEAKKRGQTLSRKVLRQISSEWRREQGMAVLVEKATAKFNLEKEKYKGLVISSLRHPAEADAVHKFGGKVIWVDADPRIRYGRILQRNRGTEGHITFEEFLAEELVQMVHSGDETTLNLSGVKARADVYIENNGNDRKAFKAAARKALKSL